MDRKQKFKSSSQEFLEHFALIWSGGRERDMKGGKGGEKGEKVDFPLIQV